jgi:hypothetical protein
MKALPHEEWLTYLQGLRSYMTVDALNDYQSFKANILNEYQLRVDSGEVKGKKKAFLVVPNKEEKKFQGNCYNCGKAGHMKKNCWQKGGGQKRQVNQTKKEDNDKRHWAFMAAKAVEKDSWILDSGATDHVTNEKEKLKEFVALPSTVWLANGVTQMKS